MSRIFFTTGARSGEMADAGNAVIDIDDAWNEKQQIFKLSGKIVRTSNITQSAIGHKDGLWTTVISAAVLLP